jgi:toxin ParE1/3/4
MPRVVHTRLARQDLLDIWAHIAADSPHAADRLLDTIDSKISLLAENPKLGRARSDIAPDLRYLPVGNYLILYREIAEGIEVVRVLHGARNLRAIFHTDD